jgi:8-oxo-dGTP diphosphatase
LHENGVNGPMAKKARGRTEGDSRRKTSPDTSRKAPKAERPLPAPRWRSTDSKSPRERHDIEIIARGVLMLGSRVLLCRSMKGGYLYLPGGHVEFAESARAAVEREFFEETGLRVRAGHVLLASEASFTTAKRVHHEVSLVFHVEDASGHVLPEAVQSREKKIAFEWVDLAAVVDLDVRPGAHKALLASGGMGGGLATGLAWVSEIAPVPGK